MMDTMSNLEHHILCENAQDYYNIEHAAIVCIQAAEPSDDSLCTRLDAILSEPLKESLTPRTTIGVDTILQHCPKIKRKLCSALALVVDKAH